MQLCLSLLYQCLLTLFCVLLQPMSELQPEGVAYENIKNNKQTKESTTSPYQDLDLRPQENTGQYQELFKNPETPVKLLNINSHITYETL